MSATNAAIYLRISQDRTGEGLGVARQEEDCRKLAAALGWSVRRVLSDNDTSAFSGKKRPNYSELLRAMKSGEIKGVIAWAPDRLHRAPIELEEYLAVSDANQVLTHTVQSGLWDLTSPGGRVAARVLGGVARFESELKGQRIKRAREQQALAGGWHGGIRPYGFEADGVTLRESEALEIKNAIEQIIAGVSLRSLVRDLNDRHVSTVTGKSGWTSVSLKEMILRPRIAGLSSYHGEIVAKAAWLPIVQEDTWRAVCAILSDPSRATNKGRSGSVRWLGSGIYLCGVCNQPQLRVGSGTGGRKTYRCSNRDNTKTSGHVTREAYSLDSYVERVIVARLSRDDARDMFVVSDSLADRGALELQKAGIDARLTELATLFSDGSITGAQLKAGTAPLRARAEAITQELAESAATGPLAELADIEDIEAAWFGTLPDRSDGLGLGKRRAILSALATVTVLPARRGPAFDPRFVQIDWLN